MYFRRLINEYLSAFKKAKKPKSPNGNLGFSGLALLFSPANRIKMIIHSDQQTTTS